MNLKPSGGNGILPRDQPSLPPFNSNNRVIDQQRWAAGRRKDEDLELHPGMCRAKKAKVFIVIWSCFFQFLTKKVVVTLDVCFCVVD